MPNLPLTSLLYSLYSLHFSDWEATTPWAAVLDPPQVSGATLKKSLVEAAMTWETWTRWRKTRDPITQLNHRHPRHRGHTPPHQGTTNLKRQWLPFSRRKNFFMCILVFHTYLKPCEVPDRLKIYVKVTSNKNLQNFWHFWNRWNSWNDSKIVPW